jgi:hypothetical protein
VDAHEASQKRAAGPVRTGALSLLASRSSGETQGKVFDNPRRFSHPPKVGSNSREPERDGLFSA